MDSSPEWLWGPLKFYRVDTGRVSGIVTVKVDVDAVVDCPPRLSPYLLGRRIQDLAELNPDVIIRRFTPDLEQEDRYRRTGKIQVLTGGRQKR